MSRHSKVIDCTHRHTHTHRQHETITFPHTRAVNILQKPTAIDSCYVVECLRNPLHGIFHFTKVSRI